MSTLTVLKEYLLGKDRDMGYLLNPDNNGKTVMLSGAWGSGKTHFWLEDIKPKLTDKKQKNIYISLYGKESIGELKFEVLREAYNLEVTEDFISKTASMISSIAPSLGEKSLVDGYDKLNKAAKNKKAKEILKSGSIICLDDFERKSKKIDLNDLFGYISQLALDYNCKVVIILNSEVFEGEEANVFKTVKEKTVNKFFYFEPTRKELFDSIYDRKDERYKKLNDYRKDIFNAIDETEELNARIYIQVLDNCLEWIEKGYDNDAVKALIFSTIYFIKSHDLLSYGYLNHNDYDGEQNYHNISYSNITNYSLKIIKYINSISTIGDRMEDEYGMPKGTRTNEQYLKILKKINDVNFIDRVEKEIVKKNRNNQNLLSETEQKYYLDWIIKNKENICEFWKYGYRLYYMDTVSEATYEIIANFIKTGILPKKNKELS